MRLIAFLLLILIASPARAFPAIVASVHDGDTITVIANGHYETVRLAGIDAPELRFNGKWPDQPFGWDAHTLLANLILGQTVDVEPTGHVSYGRVVATVTYEDTDLAMLLVEHGAAWVDERYDRDAALLDLERRAKAAHRGLWADANAIPPWTWRHHENRESNRPLP